MDGGNRIRRIARYIRHCRTVGRAEARRRIREQKETERIRKAREKGAVLTAEERAEEQRCTGTPEVRFHVILTEKNCPEEAAETMMRSLRDQTYACADAGRPVAETRPEDYIVFAEKDGFLHPSALYEAAAAIRGTGSDLIYTDEDFFEVQPGDLHCPYHKPDYGPETLRGCNILGPLLICRKELLNGSGAEDYAEADADGRWDRVIRMAEKARRIVHIPRVLYYRRIVPGEEIPTPRVRHPVGPVSGEPLVSILIPNRDHREDLKRCVDSILGKTTWKNYEIILLENNSEEEETFAYYRELEQDPRIRVIRQEGPFNYSAVNNAGFREARGDPILLLNNDTEVLSPDWLQEMLFYARMPDIGAVGAKLYYPDGTIQHAGIGLGIKMLAGHYHRGFPGNSAGYFGRLRYAQNVSAVTAACMMIPARVYREMNGLDESFRLVFNDVDLCLRIRQAGYRIVWTPWAELAHYESKSRGPDEDTPEKRKFFVRETNRFLRKWTHVLEAGDPFYNPNLTREEEDFSLR